MRFLFFLSSLLFFACQSPMDNKPVADTCKRLAAIRNGVLVFADSSTQAIPHYGDPNYITFYCVRHAEKVKDGSANPDLTPEGKARAEKLGRLMDEARLDKVCTTNALRTIKTGESVRYWAGDPGVETFLPSMQDTWLEDKLVEDKGRHLFYVGHQNTVPQLLNRLMGKVQYQNIPDDTFDRFYIAITQGVGKTEVLEFCY